MHETQYLKPIVFVHTDVPAIGNHSVSFPEAATNGEDESNTSTSSIGCLEPKTRRYRPGALGYPGMTPDREGRKRMQSSCVC
jgi:hypothetical protein